MVRFLTIGITGLILAAVASAGQIEIGGSSGLTSSYVTAANEGGFVEKNYVNALFEGEVSSAVPFTGYTTSGSIAVGDTKTDSAGDGGSGVTFAMIANNTTGGGQSANFWEGASEATPENELTVPVGIYGVTDVWTMMNLISGDLNSSGRDVNIYFNFSTAGATGSITTTVGLKLTNSGTTYNASPMGDLQDSVICTSDCPSSDTDNGPTLSSDTPTLTGGSPSGVNVVMDRLYNLGFGDSITGNLVLDDQGFFFTGTALADALSSYLVNIQIQEVDSASGSAVGLSAVTVDATPEPSTILLFLTGLGAIGFSRLRRA